MQASFNTLDPPGSGFHHFFTVLVGMFRQDFAFTFNIVRQDFTQPVNLLSRPSQFFLPFYVIFQYFLVENTQILLRLWPGVHLFFAFFFCSFRQEFTFESFSFRQDFTVKSVKSWPRGVQGIEWRLHHGDNSLLVTSWARLPQCLHGRQPGLSKN